MEKTNHHKANTVRSENVIIGQFTNYFREGERVKVTRLAGVANSILSSNLELLPSNTVSFDKFLSL